MNRYIHETTGEDRPSIELTEVESGQVKAIGHDPATNTLAVQFKFGAGAIYHYPNVTAEQHQAFVGAESIGKHFGSHIKPLDFEKYRKAPEPKVEAAPEKIAEGEA